MYTSLTSFSTCAHAFSSGLAKLEGLVIFVCSPGSRFKFFKGSQSQSFKIMHFHYEILEVPMEQLNGCECVSIDMKEGGL